MNLRSVFLNSLILLIGGICTYLLWSLGNQYAAGGVLLFTSITLHVFSHPRFYQTRFLYPGLVTFIFLMVLPILATLIISTTRLSTGHFLSSQGARELILQEKYLPEQEKLIPIKGYLNEDQLILIDQKNYLVEMGESFSEGALVFKSIPEGYKLESLSLASPREIIDFFDKHTEVSFLHPEYPKESFQFYRSNTLANIKPIYHSLDPKTIINTQTQETYHLNKEHGRFISEAGHELSPGFYTWVGLQNYLTLIQNEDIRDSFYHVFIWTMVWGVLSVFLSFSLGITLAIILNDKNLKLKGLYRGLFILPYSIPFFISVLIFKGMLNKDFGPINQILTSLSLPAIPWLQDALWAKVACLLVNLWLGFPYMFLVTTGILQSIPESIYEAAKLDGAGAWNRFKSITLPLIMTSVAPLLIGSFAFNINNFVGIYLLTGGGPPMEGSSTQVGQTDILISYTYRLAFEGGQGQNFGLASSIAVIIFILVATITYINFRLIKTDSEHG
jgi:maltose/maltodextrin transport system permease protein